ncbi:uncharacterized protein LOC126825392 [Patella vulgata]|uniref:uncharacterized protein LOC126825392 n=1 Tax=Patella vulgata TaxID=6465 RepID=UPI00217FFC0C|nr:uncharacterized protein LOC126825392 [Patella vulgata]
MELKVWVDGIQRIICGVTNETTCHDVIIALANAMGQIGRFTLVEKWRDIERPLPPHDFPALALQKWGEYASEVKLHLCQSDSEKKKGSCNKQSKTVDKFSHSFSPPEQSAETSSSIKRSSTFSGARNLNPTPKSHHEKRVSRLQSITENNHSEGLHPLPHSSSFTRPVPSPRCTSSSNRTVSPLDLTSARNIQNNTPVASKSSYNIAHPLPNRPFPNHNIQNGFAKQHHYSNHEHFVPDQSDINNAPFGVRNSIGRSRSPRHRIDDLVAIEHTLEDGNHSHASSLEIEEYDLDRNFPDILRDSNRTDLPSVHTEYMLDHNVEIGLDPEHARLVRLVTAQQDRLKTQESQIDHVNTEIVTLEEKEKEYEEQLQKITTELLMLEQRQREEESEVIQLESVSMEEKLVNSQKQEQDLQLQISQLKSKRLICEKQINDNRFKETQLNKNIADIKNEIKNSEKKVYEEEQGFKVEINQLKEKQAIKQKDCDTIERELQSVDNDLKTLESVYQRKVKEVDKIEEELKEENLKSLEDLTPLESTSEPATTNNGEAILKILEGRLSPRPGTTSSKLNTPQVFINSLSTKNPNGVWV